MGLLFIVFIVMPIVEMSLLISVGSHIGAVPTILLVIFTGITGAWLAKHEGMRTMLTIREQLAQGVVPAQEMVAGMLIFAGGVLLLTPGFITDALGFSFILPGSRTWWLHFFSAYFEKKIADGTIHVHAASSVSAPERSEQVIDAEYREIPSENDNEENR